VSGENYPINKCLRRLGIRSDKGNVGDKDNVGDEGNVSNKYKYTTLNFGVEI